MSRLKWRCDRGPGLVWPFKGQRGIKETVVDTAQLIESSLLRSHIHIVSCILWLIFAEDIDFEAQGTRSREAASQVSTVSYKYGIEMQ